jgi:uncharacterized protein YecE (DUF72 family)
MVGAGRPSPAIRVGIGGWTYAPWRGLFYPPGLKQADELAYASRRVTSIEVNGTFYRLQTPQSFRRWAAETPDDFMFSLKAPRYATHRRVLAESGPAIDRFLASGPVELGAKLGPILWQFPPTAAFHAEDFAAFLALLPDRWDGHALRHAVEVRHASFVTPTFVALARHRRVAIVYADSAAYPAIADPTADFVYARLQRAAAGEKAGYAPAALDRWAERCRQWAAGEAPADLPLLAPSAPRQPRDVFVYFINGAKERAPAAAIALIERSAR